MKIACPECGGRGVKRIYGVDPNAGWLFMATFKEIKCPDCNGKGEVESGYKYKEKQEEENES